MDKQVAKIADSSVTSCRSWLSDRLKEWWLWQPSEQVWWGQGDVHEVLRRAAYGSQSGKLGRELKKYVGTAKSNPVMVPGETSLWEGSREPELHWRRWSRAGLCSFLWCPLINNCMYRKISFWKKNLLNSLRILRIFDCSDHSFSQVVSWPCAEGTAGICLGFSPCSASEFLRYHWARQC